VTRLDELYEMRTQIDAEIERERAQLWRIAELRDQVYDVLSRHTTSTAATLVAVAEFCDVPVTDIVSRIRTQAAMDARHITAWLLRDQGLSFPQVGKVLGRDHTTAMSSCRRVAASAELGDTADRIRSLLRATPPLELVAS
jgi:chromosomal replication initiation ATPase DnaA